jgi:hypothetical protein
VEKYDRARQAASDKLCDENKLQLAPLVTMARIRTHTLNIYYVLLYHGKKCLRERNLILRDAYVAFLLSFFSPLFFFYLSSLSVGETEHVTVFISLVPRRTIRDVPGIQKCIDYEEKRYHQHICDLCGPYKIELSRLAQAVSFLFLYSGRFRFESQPGYRLF